MAALVLSVSAALPFAAFGTAFAADKQPAGIVVDNAWFATMPNNGPTYGYFHIVNHGGDPKLLTGFSAPPCSSLKLEEAHSGTSNSKAAVQMTVAPKSSMVFSRGGYHLVCQRKADAPSPGQTVPVVITLDGGVTVPVSFTVRPPLR